MATECFCVTIGNNQVDEPIEMSVSTNSLLTSTNLGEYMIGWRRMRIFAHESLNENESNQDQEDEERDEQKADAHSEFNVLTKVDLPSVSYEPFPLLIETKVPSSGCLNQAIQVAYRVHNRTLNLIEAECNLDENEFFAISGNKLVSLFNHFELFRLTEIYQFIFKKQKVQIMPKDSTEYTFSLFPMQAGYSKLPKFNLKLENMPALTSDQSRDKPSLISSISTTNIQQQQQQNSASNGSLTSDFASKSIEFEEIIQSMIPSHLFIFPAKPDRLAAL